MNASQSPHNDPEKQGKPSQSQFSAKMFDSLYADGLYAMRNNNFSDAETALSLAYDVAQKIFFAGDLRIFQSLEAYAKACEANQKTVLHETLLVDLVRSSKQHKNYDYLISGTVNLAVVKIEDKEFDEGCRLAQEALDIATQNKERHPILPACHFICALAHLHQEKYQAGYQAITEGFWALETLEGRDTSRATKAMLTELSSFLTYKLMYADARRCALKLIELHEENSAHEHVNTYISSLQLLAKIDSFFGQSSKAAAGFRRVLDVFESVDTGSLPRTIGYLYGRQLLNSGRIEESIHVFTRLIDEAIENPSQQSDHEFIDHKLALASALTSRGSLQEAHDLLRQVEQDLYSRLPREMSELVRERPQDIGDELDALVYSNEIGTSNRQQIISDLTDISTTSHLMAQLEDTRGGQDAMAFMMTRVHGLSDALSSAGAQAHLEFLKMTFTDPDPSDSKLEFLEGALSSENLNAYEELGLRCLASDQCIEQDRESDGLSHLRKAHALYQTLLADTYSIEHAGLFLSYAQTCIRYRAEEKAIAALEHLVSVFDSTEIKTNRDLVEALEQLSALYQSTDEDRASELKQRAQSTQKKLVLNNPIFYADREAEEE